MDEPTTPGGGSGGSASGRPEAASHNAPSYVNTVIGDYISSKPKGKNLTEGGFESDDTKNASFTADIGSENDPGREAELKFGGRGAQTGTQAGTTPSGGGSGSGATERKSDQPYEALGGDQQV